MRISYAIFLLFSVYQHVSTVMYLLLSVYCQVSTILCLLSSILFSVYCQLPSPTSLQSALYPEAVPGVCAVPPVVPELVLALHQALNRMTSLHVLRKKTGEKSCLSPPTKGGKERYRDGVYTLCIDLERYIGQTILCCSPDEGLAMWSQHGR